MWQSWTILLQAFRMYRDVFHMLLHGTCKPMKSRWKNYFLLSVSVILHLAPRCQSLPAATPSPIWNGSGVNGRSTSYLKRTLDAYYFFCHIWEVLIKKHGCLKRRQDKESQPITLFSSDRLTKEGLFRRTEKYLKGSKDHRKSETIWLSVSGGRKVVLSSDPVFFMSRIILVWCVWELVCE